MSGIESLRKLLDAIVTALAVVFGLKPDPTRVPVRVKISHPPVYRNR